MKVSFIFIDKISEHTGYPVFKSLMEDIQFNKLFPTATVKELGDNKYKIQINPIGDDVKTREQIIFEFGMAVGMAEFDFYTTVPKEPDMDNPEY